MATIAFDTLKLARDLREKGHFSQQDAEGTAFAIADAMQGDIATKADLIATKADLMAALSDTKAEILKWVFGAIGFQTLVIIGTHFARG